jgi:flagellin
MGLWVGKNRFYRVAFRQLSTNTDNQSKAIEKLSSGLSSNRAGDDAAGLAKMRGQIRGLDQASRNAQDGISMIQTSEGALNETHSILQRMRELAVQGSNDTNTSTDRSAMQQEVNQLSSEIDRIDNTTQFNKKNLLDGTSGKNALVTASTGTGNLTKVLSTGPNAIGGTYNFTVTAATGAATKASYDNTGALDTGVNGTASNLVLNGVALTFAAGTAAADMASAINAKSNDIGFTATAAGGKLTFQANDYGTGYTLTASGTSSSMVGTATAGTNVTFSTLPPGVTATIDSKHGSVATLTGGAVDGTKIDTAGVGAGSTFALTVADNSLNFQIGANQGQTINVSMQDMRSAALGVNNINLTSATTATAAITTIDAAINSVSTERAKYGAYQNRIEHTINNLNTSSRKLDSCGIPYP